MPLMTGIPRHCASRHGHLAIGHFNNTTPEEVDLNAIRQLKEQWFTAIERLLGSAG